MSFSATEKRIWMYQDEPPAPDHSNWSAVAPMMYTTSVDHREAQAADIPPSTWTTNLPKEIGGAERDRTADLRSAIAALSHLSYSPVEAPAF